jgi:hypothetical protein
MVPPPTLPSTTTTQITEPPPVPAPTTTTTACIEVPNVMGKSYSAAEIELINVGFRPYGGIPAPNSDAVVVSEIPAGGSCVLAYTAIQVAAPGP